MLVFDFFSRDWFILLGIWVGIVAVFVGSWRLSMKIENKLLRGSAIFLILILVFFCVFAFFVTCFGIGVGGCQ
jgi:hypothetical protein